MLAEHSVSYRLLHEISARIPLWDYRQPYRYSVSFFGTRDGQGSQSAMRYGTVEVPRSLLIYR